MSDISSDEAPAPRLCHLIKWPDFDGYGFNLHAERSNPGQFIGKIDDQSPAQMAGLREGDRIIEVNGVNINNENHRQVVERIKSEPEEARLLVVDPQTDLWYREHELVVKSSQINVIYIKTPVPRPQPDSPRAKHNGGPAAQTAAGAGQQQQQQRSKSESASEQTKQQQQQQESSQTNEKGSGQKEEEKKQEQTGEQQQQKQSASQSAPAADSPSLETSDFNDDSIEQAQNPQQQRTRSATPTQRAPMSPDSGRGGDELQQQPGQTQHVLTVEAEINRQTSVAGVDSLDRSRKQQVVEEVRRQLRDAAKFKKQRASQERHQDASPIEPDSLQDEHDQIQTSVVDPKERARQVHNRSADSGKSSSRETATSGADSDNNEGQSSSMVDSLDEHLEVERRPEPNEQREKARGSAAAVKADAEVQAASGQQQTSSTTPTKTTGKLNEHAAAAKTGVVAAKAAGNNELQAEVHKSISINNNNNIDHEDHVAREKPAVVQTSPHLQPASPKTNSFTTNSNSNTTAAANNNNSSSSAATTNNQQQQQPNNKLGPASGLNLNMTASQMRELISSRKKFDPKKAQMNIRQKYEIIQQM